MNWFEKTFTCVDEKGEYKLVKVIPKKVLTRNIPAFQLKKYARKGCKLIVVRITENNGDQPKPCFQYFPLLNEFKDIFRKEIPGLPPRMDTDFTIEFVLGVVSASKDPYRINTHELVELKLQLQELID